MDASDEKLAEYTIDLLNGRLVDGTILPDDLVKLYKLCMSRKKKAIAHLCVVTGMFLCTHSSLTFHQTLEVALCAFDYWKNDSFMSKGQYRINISTERRYIIEDTAIIFGSLDEKKHAQKCDIVGINLGMVLESCGDFVKALAVYSDMITREAHLGVDLAYVIFRAAVVLLHLGRESQAVDYLDFIQEDAPRSSGYGRAHVLALLYIIYEGRGGKFSHMLEAVNTAFQHIREDEMPFLLELAERKRAPNERASQHSFVTLSSAKIWEALALQAMSRGDYVYAVEMLKQLLKRKPPSPSGVFLTLSEAFYVLSEKELALQAAETSYDLESQNVEVRNMLLLIAPEKWQERLRLAAPVRVMKIAVSEDEEALNEADLRSRLVQRKGAGNSPQKEKPREVIPTVGGEWLTHKITPFNKNFHSPEGSPAASPVRSLVGSVHSVQETPNHSEFDLQDLFTNPSTGNSRVNSRYNTPRHSDVDAAERAVIDTEKEALAAKKTRSAAAIQAARRKSLRPEKPSVAMDEATKRLVQAMLSGGDPVISMTAPTSDIINKRLSAHAPSTTASTGYMIGDAILEEDGEDGDREEFGDKKLPWPEDAEPSWLYKGADEGEDEHNSNASGIAFRNR